MSRHRNVRNMRVEDMYDYYDEEYSEEEYYEEEEYCEEEESPLEAVQQVLGTQFSISQINKALKKFNNNVEKTIDYLLSGMNSSGKRASLLIENNDFDNECICPGIVIDYSYELDKRLVKKDYRLRADLIEETAMDVDSPLLDLNQRSALQNEVDLETKSLDIGKMNLDQNRMALDAPKNTLVAQPQRDLSSLASSIIASKPKLSLSSLATSRLQKSENKPIPVFSVPNKKITLESLKNNSFAQKQPKMPLISLSSLKTAPKEISEKQVFSPNLATLPNSTKRISSSSLKAMPSPGASFICQANTKACTSLLADFPRFTLETSQKAFKFDTPSPDDIALKSKQKPGISTLNLAPVKKQQPKIAKSNEKAVDSLSMDLEALGFKSQKTSQSSIDSTLTPTASIPKLNQQPLTKGKRIDIKAEFAKRSSQKPTLNLVVVGHVDAGKSTMMGHVLLLLGKVGERAFKKYQHESEAMKKGSFSFAWVLDETEDERSRGVTIDVGISQFSTEKFDFVLLDAPGHKDFIPNMISGASQADVAILVVDASIGEFETGFEHVHQIIVAVNKMDTVGWSKDRYDEVCQILSVFLNTAGFKKKHIQYVPVSGFSGDNLQSRQIPELDWYTGPTLIDAMNNFEPILKPIDGPFRLSVQDLFKGGLGSTGGDCTVVGRIESGSIQIGDPILAMPIKESGHVKAIEHGETQKKYAVCGDRVSLVLVGLDILQLGKGTILCNPSNPIPITDKIQAQIVTLDIKIPLTIGVPVIWHQLGVAESATLSALLSILDKQGKELKRNPRSLSKNVTSIVEITLKRPIPCETFTSCKELGRFTLRSGSTSVAVGIITKVINFH